MNTRVIISLGEPQIGVPHLVDDRIEQIENIKKTLILNYIRSFKPNDLCVKCKNCPLNGGRCTKREDHVKLCEQ